MAWFEYGKIVMSAAVGMAVSTAFADVTLDGETEYPVASGAQTVSERVTGPGSILKTGAGTLVLSNAGNDFTDGVNIAGGSVQAGAVGALGAGTVTVGEKGAKLELIAPKAASGYNVYTNPVSITGTSAEGLSGGVTDGTWSLYFGPDKDTKIQLTGGVTATRSFRMRTFTTVSSPSTCAGPEVVFDCPVNAAGKTVYVQSYGTITFNRAIAADTVYFGDAWSAGGIVNLGASDNAVGTYLIDNERVFCKTNDVLGGIVSWFSTGTAPSPGRAMLDLCGFGQTVSGLSYTLTGNAGWDATRLMSGDYQCVKSTTGPATLKIVGSAVSQTTYATIREGVSLLVDAQGHPGFVQSFRYNASATAGSLIVSNGTLRIYESATFANATSVLVGPDGTFINDSTKSAASLAGVKTLKVDGTFDASGATSNPFSGTLTSIEIGDNAVLKFPSGSTISASSVTVGGQTHTAACLTSNSVPQLVGVTIFVTGTSPAAVNWTGTVSDSLKLTNNWSSEPEFVYGSMKPVFAASGNFAAVDRDAAFGGIDFDADGGFTLARAAAPKTLLISGDITTKPAGSARKYVIDNPVKIYGDRTVALATNQTLEIKDAFTADDSLAGRLTIGAAGLTFAGTNVFAGGIAPGVSRVNVSGLLASPGHAYEGYPAEGARDVFYLNLQAGGGKGGVEDCGLCLSNAVVEKAVLVTNCIGCNSIEALANTTNEVKGFVRYIDYSHERVNLRGKSELTLSGGMESVHSFRVYYGGRLRIRERPARFLGSAGLNPNDGTVSLEVAHNTITNLCVGYNSGGTAVVETMVDYAITNGNVQVGGNGGDFSSAVGLAGGTFTLDLHSTTQRCQRVGVMKQGILKGEYPAMLEVSEGRPASGVFAKFGYSIVGQVNGGVGFHMCGDEGSVLLFTNRTFASCGDLKVSSGIMEFSADACWPNGTNVTVCGTGVLKVGSGNAFSSRHVKLALAGDGKVYVPNGKQLVVKSATLEGADIAPGAYPTGSLEGAVTGGGSLYVKGLGLMISVR